MDPTRISNTMKKWPFLADPWFLNIVPYHTSMYRNLLIAQLTMIRQILITCNHQPGDYSDFITTGQRSCPG